MPTAKLLSLFGASILRTSSKMNRSALKCSTFPSLPLRDYCASSAAEVNVVTSETAEPIIEPPHSWPEWVAFVERLKDAGYLREGGESGDGKGGEVVVYRDMTLLKDACLSFARDRYDILRLLSRDDIQKVVEKGCPNILRKTVNSGKRLRAYLQLDEGDVCSGCSLRGSCDRAYVILKETEGNVRTVDVVRVLLNHALDPLVLSEERPSGMEILEASARKLLVELTQLSRTSFDPELPKLEPKIIHQREPSLVKDKFSRDVEMKRGDWMCPKCNFLNFSRNLRCFNCKEDGPCAVGGKDVEMRKGDWICSRCNFMNFARNMRCLDCKAEGPKRIEANDIEMKKGDWICAGCKFMNFASNLKCLRCQGPCPKRQLNPGEWECPSCNFLNFNRNAVCLKCSCKRPDHVEAQYQEQLWRNPF